MGSDPCPIGIHKRTVEVVPQSAQPTRQLGSHRNPPFLALIVDDEMTPRGQWSQRAVRGDAQVAEHHAVVRLYV